MIPFEGKLTGGRIRELDVSGEFQLLPGNRLRGFLQLPCKIEPGGYSVRTNDGEHFEAFVCQTFAKASRQKTKGHGSSRADFEGRLLQPTNH